MVNEDRNLHDVSVIVLLLSLAQTTLYDLKSRQLHEEPRHWLGKAIHSVLLVPKPNQSLNVRPVLGRPHETYAFCAIPFDLTFDTSRAIQSAFKFFPKLLSGNARVHKINKFRNIVLSLRLRPAQELKTQHMKGTMPSMRSLKNPWNDLRTLSGIRRKPKSIQGRINVAEVVGITEPKGGQKLGVRPLRQGGIHDPNVRAAS